ncbi:MAG: acetyl-CoA C-acyltransferase [Hellea sp.]|nr:acetyl-CoA C-acyltransferase [Hellea sp.]
MLSKNIYIYDAVRTPRAKGKSASLKKPGGALSKVLPHDLIKYLVEAIEQRNPNSATNINRLALGCVGQIGPQGGHIALVSRLASSLLKNDITVRTLNNYCVSGLSAVFEAALWAQNSFQGLSLAGGVESLSQVGFLEDKASYYNDPDLIKKLNWAPPVMGAELIATIDGLKKSDLDDITLLSHQRAENAWNKGFYDKSVISIPYNNGEEILKKDALIKPNLTIEKLTQLKPFFGAQGTLGYDAMMLNHYPFLREIKHLHSIANCPGMADGASLILLGTKEAGDKIGLKPRARIVDFTETADSPVIQLSAGFKAMEKLLHNQKMNVNDIDRYEFMEAFAALPVKFLNTYNVDINKVNVNGGHLAMGHPMGATGAILITTLLNELEYSNAQKGMVVAQAGGGIGAAMIIERVN